MVPVQYQIALSTLRDKSSNQVCQLDLTKVKCLIDKTVFYSDQMAGYLSARPSAALFALIKFKLGSHRLRVETDRWLPVKPPIGQRICCHCYMNAVEKEQHFLFDCPPCTGISTLPCLVLTKVAFASFWSAMLTKYLWSPTTFTCAFMPGCPMSYIRLPNPDCKFH